MYILTAWRIPGKISESMKEISKKPPVILQHGLLDNSATWSINYFNNTLPYLLLEEGYDVWLTNNRGNFNSYEHTNPFNYSVFDMKSKYWNFSFDQMAKYDLPANIDYKRRPLFSIGELSINKKWLWVRSLVILYFNTYQHIIE